MPTGFSFTQDQLSEIVRLRQIILDNADKAQASGAVPIYSYIFKCVTGMDASAVAAGAISIGDLPDNQRLSATWLLGAIQVNSSDGAFSKVIREFNTRQGELRLDKTFATAELQTASNRVGLNLANSILNATDDFGRPNLIEGKLPTVQEIGNSDLNGVRDVLYPGNENPGSELYLNQAWPGIVMLGALGGKYWDRLLRYEDSQPVALDTLSDLKSLLYCWDSFRTAWDKTCIGVTSITDVLVGFNFPSSMIAGVLSEYAAHGSSGASGMTFNYMLNAQQPSGDFSKAMGTISVFGSNKFLDMLMGASAGKSLLGTTTDANFAEKARTFFNAYGATLQTINAELLPTAASALAAKAQTDVNARAALAALSVVSMDGSAVTKDQFSLYDSATGSGNITQNWIADRAAFTAYNYTKLQGLGGIVNGSDNLHYFDAASKTDVLVGAGSSLRKQYLFGGDSADTMTGGGVADRIYGGGGNDLLSGLGGSDYLEGNAGNDMLDGGAGADTLFGGTGTDTYTFTGTFGNDTLTDSDGKGSIVINGNPLTGGSKVAGNAWVSTDKTISYALINSDLVISQRASGSVAGTITVNGWHNGQLGITLPGAGTPEEPDTDRTIRGDLAPLLPLTTDTYGNVLVGATPEADRADTLYDSNYDSRHTADAPEDDYIVAGGGDDQVFAATGDDWLDLGAGRDMAKAGAGDDWIETGPGADMALGQQGDDELYGDSMVDVASLTASEIEGGPALAGPGEVLDGGTGNDTVVGSDTPDFLTGGLGQDVIAALAGDDNIYADATIDSVTRDWRATRSALTDSTGAKEFKLDRLDLFISPNGASAANTGDADRVHAGAGDDWVFLAGGDDYADAGSGDDVVLGQAGSDTILLGAGNDVADGDSADTTVALRGNDSIDGGAGNDTLYGNGGNDTLLGGPGNDMLDGGAGDDRFSFNLGDGHDTLADSLGTDTIVVGAGIAPESVTLSYTPTGWRLALADGSTLDIQRPAQSMAFGAGPTDAYSIERIEFAAVEGQAPQAWDRAEIVDRLAGSMLMPTLAGDVLTAGPTFDGTPPLVLGLAGDDQLQTYAPGGAVHGGPGNDELWGEAAYLHGGMGSDTLRGAGSTFNGGPGSDEVFTSAVGNIYEVQRGGGWDTFHTQAATAVDGYNDFLPQARRFGDADTVRFGDGIAPADLQVTVTDDYTSGDDAQYDPATGAIAEPWGSTPNRSVLQIDLGAGDGLAIDFMPDASRAGGFFGSLTSPYLWFWGAELAANKLGTQRFEFADGSYVTLMDLLDHAAQGGELQSRPADGGNGGNGSGLQFKLGMGEVTVFGSTVVMGQQRVSSPHTIAVIEFGPGISADMLHLDKGSLRIRVGDGADQVHLLDFDDEDAYAPNPIQGLRFTDGTRLRYDQLIDRGFDLHGGAGADEMAGTSASDRIDAGDGNDTLRGGAGDDVLRGGAGDDVYLVNAGDGHDTIIDTQGSDTLRFGSGIAPGDIDVIRSGSGLVLHLRGSGDSVTVPGGDDPAAGSIERVEFADGTVWSTLAPGGLSLVGGPRRDKLVGSAGNDTLDGAGHGDTLAGGAGDDSYRVDRRDKVIELSGQGWDTLYATDSYTLPANVEALQLQGQESLRGWGNTGNNWLAGGEGGDLLAGRGGIDVLEGRGGNDTLDGGDGADVLLGGSGADRLVAGKGNAFMAGGVGNDSLLLGSGANVLAFNRGDGVDTVTAGHGKAQGHSLLVLSLGGGIAAQDVAWQRVGHDLFVDTGHGEGIRLARWYAGPTAQQQPVLQFLDGSETAALGGALALRYAAGSLAGLGTATGMDSVIALMGDPGCGIQPVAA